jgi:hypothetical protein
MLAKITCLTILSNITFSLSQEMDIYLLQMHNDLSDETNVLFDKVIKNDMSHANNNLI